VFVDVVSITTGLVWIIRRHRALPIDENIAKTWNNVWLQLRK